MSEDEDPAVLARRWMTTASRLYSRAHGSDREVVLNQARTAAALGQGWATIAGLPGNEAELEVKDGLAVTRPHPLGAGVDRDYLTLLLTDLDTTRRQRDELGRLTHELRNNLMRTRDELAERHRAVDETAARATTLRAALSEAVDAFAGYIDAVLPATAPATVRAARQSLTRWRGLLDDTALVDDELPSSMNSEPDR